MPAHTVVNFALTRRADRNRTCNLRFWRPLLCQLSYRPRDRRPRMPAVLRRDLCERGWARTAGTAKECRLQLHIQCTACPERSLTGSVLLDAVPVGLGSAHEVASG